LPVPAQAPGLPQISVVVPVESNLRPSSVPGASSGSIVTSVTAASSVAASGAVATIAS
tara:strand:- start:1029 stop:1202 length:174 start_codon:yes stop_codon:yes gene_type:complete